MSKRPSRFQLSHIIEELHTSNLLIDQREVFLHGYIANVDEDYGVDWKSANQFIKNIRILQALDKTKPILIHQHSIGGFWEDGMMMFDAIQSCECHVAIVCHGSAMSMGSIIPQAADKRIMMPNCTFMIHEGSTDIQSSMTHKQSKSWHEFERKIVSVMRDIYADACKNGKEFINRGYNRSQVRKFIVNKMDAKEDWILTARETVEYGFADAVLGDEKYETIDKIKEIW